MRHPRPNWVPSKKIWRARFSGRYIERRSEEACARELARLVARTRPAPEAPTSVARVLELYRDSLTSEPQIHVVAAGLMFAADTPLSELPPDFVQRYARSLVAAGKQPETVRKYTRFVLSALQHALSMGWVAKPQLRPRTPKPVPRPKPLKPDEAAKLLAAMPPYAAPLARFILETGCRPDEGIGLRWDAVDLDAGVCTLGAHKTAHHGKTRTLYLTATAAKIIGSMPRSARWVFPSPRGLGRYSVAGLRATIRRAGREALGREVTTYQLRHTTATILLSRGLPVQTVCDIMGWSSLSMVRRYVPANAKAARRAMQSQGVLAQPPPPPPQQTRRFWRRPPPAPPDAAARDSAPPATRASAPPETGGSPSAPRAARRRRSSAG